MGYQTNTYPQNNKRRFQEDTFLGFKKSAFLLHSLTNRDNNTIADQTKGITTVANEFKGYPKQAPQSIKMIIVGGKTMLHRAPQIAVLLALLDKDPIFSHEISESIEKEWEEAVLKNDAHEITGIIWLYLHMTAAGLISNEDYEQLLNGIVNSMNTNKCILQSDYYASILEFVLPVYNKCNEPFTQELSKKLKEFYNERKRKESEIFKGKNDVLKPYSGKSEVIPVELLTIDARREAFNASLIQDISLKLNLVQDYNLVESVTARRVSLSLARITDVEIRDVESYSYSGYIVRIFDQSCLKMEYFKTAPARRFRLPDVTDLVYWYYKRFFSDCAQIMQGSLWECSVQTLTIPCAFKDDVFATIEACAELIPGTKNEIIHEQPFISSHLTAEFVGVKIQSPLTSIHWTFSTNLLIRYCTELSSLFPATVGRLIHATFNRLQFMDISKVLLFANVFALFLSNYQVNWAFQSWVPTLLNSKNTNQIIFVKATLDKCAQLLPMESVRTKVPVEISDFLVDEFKIRNQYLQPQSHEVAFANAMISQLQSKSTNKDNEQPFETVESTIDTTLRCKIQYLCILEHGSISLSHSFAGIEKHIKFIATIRGNHLVQWTWEAWTNDTTRFYRILQRLRQLGVVKNEDIYEWFISELESAGISTGHWKTILLLFELIKDDAHKGAEGFGNALVSQFGQVDSPKLHKLMASIVVAVILKH